jgi:tRNA threonylcarbamoyl adenosine modification protein YjeE
VLPPYQHLLPPLAARGRIAVSQAQLERWGEELGWAAQAPMIIAIGGELGAGKTTLVRAICRGYGVREEVTSPTYALVHQYDGPTPVYHLDLYRLAGEHELTNIGWDDIIADHALVLVEWPERAGSRLPLQHIPIALEHVPDDPDHRVLLAG